MFFLTAQKPVVWLSHAHYVTANENKKTEAKFSTVTFSIPANHPSWLQTKAKVERCFFLFAGGTGYVFCVSVCVCECDVSLVQFPDMWC